MPLESARVAVKSVVGPAAAGVAWAVGMAVEEKAAVREVVMAAAATEAEVTVEVATEEVQEVAMVAEQAAAWAVEKAVATAEMAVGAVEAAGPMEAVGLWEAVAGLAVEEVEVDMAAVEPAGAAVVSGQQTSE